MVIIIVICVAKCEEDVAATEAELRDADRAVSPAAAQATGKWEETISCFL